MADSDEEEMAALRSSNKHAGIRKPPNASQAVGNATSRAAGSNDEDEPSHSARSRNASRGHAFGAPEEEEATLVDATEDHDDARDYFPVSFGKAQPKKTDPAEIHGGMMRKDQAAKAAEKLSSRGNVQFGPRLMDSATVAGATRRAHRAQEERLSRETAEQDEDEAPSSRLEPRERPGNLGSGVMEEDDIPLPGKEGETLPVSHEVSIPAHNKGVTALALDPKASRMVTGSLDGVVKFFDFNGMSEEKNAFRELEPVPEQGQHIQSLTFGTTGGIILVILSDSHARLYDRDGSTKPIQSTVKGDMYVRDMSHTKGHTQTLTNGFWHPYHAEQWVTSSLDGTLRLWDLQAQPVGMDQVLPSVHVLKCLDKRGVCVGGTMGRLGGLHPTCCTISPTDGKKIVGGCSDGSLQLFFEKPRYQKPDKIVRNAHTAPVTDITFVGGGTDGGGYDNLMVSRSMDNTMKVWDCRMLSDAKGPVKVWEDLPANHERTGVCTSPDGRYIVTGTSFAKGAALGAATVRVYDAKDFGHARTLDFGTRSCIRCTWPKEINQLIVGTSTGEVTMLYSPFSSKKGALHFIGKRAKKVTSAQIEGSTPGAIFNMTDKDDIKRFWGTGHGNMMKMRRGEARHSQKTLKPDMPAGLEKGTTKPQSDGMAFAALALKHGAKRLNLNSTRAGVDGDAQKVLLSYDDKIERLGQKGSLMGDAYAKTNPNNVLDWTDDMSEGDKRMQEKLKGDFCRHCGQKVCRCVDYSRWGLNKKPRTS